MATYRLKPGHARTFILGIARRPGEDVEISDTAEMCPHDREALEAHFSHVGEPRPETVARAGQAPRLRNGITAEQARAKLVNAGITFAEGAEGDALADLFDRAFAGGADGDADASPPAFGGADAASGRNNGKSGKGGNKAAARIADKTI